MNHLVDPHKAPTGHFRLWVRRRGVIVPELCMDEKNLIVNGARTAHAHLLGGDVANRSITTIGFGTSGAAPNVADTGLTGAFTKAVAATSYPDAYSVKFDFSLLAGEDNPQAISEFGLFTQGGALYARKIRSSPLNKDADLSFSGSWTISF